MKSNSINGARRKIMDWKDIKWISFIRVQKRFEK